MLREGSLVVYKRTGTIGKILEIVEIAGKKWVKLDSTGLLYDIDFIETLEEKIKEETEEKVSEKAKKEKKTIEIRDEGTMDSSAGVCGAG
ncbi:MAG: DUF2098 domain-containing protein [Candidatus Verstraetearchaeota archaeon]|nr:DUF2098 domain-containing protein [Candidatus Verstraetearchaeota archaeon]